MCCQSNHRCGIHKPDYGQFEGSCALNTKLTSTVAKVTHINWLILS